MEKSNFVSPAYSVQRMQIADVVSQSMNPNSMTSKSWEALQQSIFNTGYTFPVIVATNSEYDPSTAGQPRPNLLEVSDGESTFTEGGKIGTQVSDDEVAKFFPYRLIDGSHRTQIVRQGTYWFHNGYDRSDDWAEGNNIPDKPGPAMLAYLAWREDFTIPAVVLDIPKTKQMSAEILHNPIYESQPTEVQRARYQIQRGVSREDVDGRQVINIPKECIPEELYEQALHMAHGQNPSAGILQVGEVPVCVLTVATAYWLSNQGVKLVDLEGLPVLIVHSVVDMIIPWSEVQVGDLLPGNTCDGVKPAERLEILCETDDLEPLRFEMNANALVQVEENGKRRFVELVRLPDVLANAQGELRYVYDDHHAYTIRSVLDSAMPSLVTMVDEWCEKPCLELKLDLGKKYGGRQTLVVSKDHLLRLSYDAYEALKEDVVKLGHDLSEETLKQCKETDERWFTADAITRMWAAGNSEPMPLGDGVMLVDAQACGVGRCRCVKTSKGVYGVCKVLNHNTARGSHSLDSMKDIVYNLINVAGMSEEWVSRNLYLDLESIRRMQQLSGLKASFAGGDNGDIDDTDMAWTPEGDDSYGRKLQAFLTREATKYVELYRQEHKDEPEMLAKIPENGSALDIAMAIGFDQTAVAQRHAERYMHVTDQ